MNYYAARQRQKDMKWNYTVRHGEFTQAVGYCSPYYEWTEELFQQLGIPIDHPSIILARSFKDKHHDCGHETKEEACCCYREYLIDQRLRLNIEDSNTQKKCIVCEQWTTLYASINEQTWNLCEKHNNREEIEKLFQVPDEIWSS